MKIGVIGAGAWGTAFANYLCELGHNVSIWVHQKDLCEIMLQKRENTIYLPNIKLSENLGVSSKIDDVVFDREILVFAVPVQKMRPVLEGMKIEGEPILINLSKGIEQKSLLFPSELIGSFFPMLDIAVLSGPSFAVEFARGCPTVLVAASNNETVAKEIRDRFSSTRLRIYSSPDIIGVELGGAMKNVIAIGCGIIDALGLGENARAALIARGLSEMVRLGVALGAKIETLFGLAGLGDLVLTGTSEKSRNYLLGKLLASNVSTNEALSHIKGIPEGLWSSTAIVELGKNFNIELPICQEIYQVLKGERSPEESIRSLMERELKDEWKNITQLIVRDNL